MTVRKEVPPIRIPIEVTIEDKEQDKVRKKIGKRKRKRNTDTHFGPEDVPHTSLREERIQEEKERKRAEKREKKQTETRRKIAERLLQKRVRESDRKEAVLARKKEFARQKKIGFGKAAIGQIANIGHPLGIATSLIGRLVPIAVPLVIISATESIIKALTQKGSIFDLTFRNIVDNRNNVLRARESQQEIRVGFEGKSQLIVTTRAGTTSPILSYNTYEQRNNNTLEFEKMRAVREIGGI